MAHVPVVPVEPEPPAVTAITPAVEAAPAPPVEVSFLTFSYFPHPFNVTYFSSMWLKFCIPFVPHSYTGLALSGICAM